MNAIILLAMAGNLTDAIVEGFGLETMNSLWPVFMTLFDVLESVFSVDLTPLWERLFT